ncbi:MAG: neutral zinc metallopeptidase [Candidatus Limnocylindrales bacterium]
MTFDPNVQLDPSQVTDARGGGGRLGGRGGGLAVGGGGLGLVIAIIYVLLGGNPGDLAGTSGGAVPNDSGPLSSALAQCTTGAAANAREDCQIVGYVDSIQAFWATQVQGYTKSKTVLFTDAISTGCGSASSASGPFYCPVDKRIYLDLGFFAELQSRFGAKDAPFARAYVVAHEYGHHVQDLLGDLQTGGSTGATGRSVRTELQADCYAGVWAHNAQATGFIQPLTPEQIAAADAAAKAVGDDRIQQATQGQVTPDSFTHGTSAQRVRWFTTGYTSGKPKDCDTFSAPTL